MTAVPKITIKGLNEIEVKFSKMEKDIPGMLEDLTRDAVVFVHSEMPSYPPQRPTWYIRTMTLWRSITTLAGRAPGAISRVEKLSGEVHGYVGSNVTYAPDVIGEGEQAGIHEGYWWTLQGVVSDLRSQIKEVYEKGVHNYIRSHFK